MSPREQLESYCQRYGVPDSFGERLLPLLEKADHAAPAIRERILELVETSFEKEAQRLAWQKARAVGGSDERILRTVASALHGWSPTKRST